MKKFSPRWLYFGLSLFLLLTAAYYIGGRAAGTTTPWTWNRNDGETAIHNGRQHFSVHAGVIITSTINSSAASAVAFCEGNCIDFSSVAVRSGSTHPLAIACAEKIAEKLKTIPAIQQITFTPHGPIIGKDEPLPSQFVQVNVDNLNERTVPNRSLTGNINIIFGTAAAKLPSVYGNDGIPPLVHFEHNATLEGRFAHIGLCTQSIFCDKIAEDIAKKTLKIIEEEIGKLNKSTTLLPKLPKPFYPAYREASDMPPIPGLVSATMLVAGRRLMLPHYSLVQIESNFKGTGEEFLTAVQEAMNESGWSGNVQKEGGNRKIFASDEKRSNVLPI